MKFFIHTLLFILFNDVAHANDIEKANLERMFDHAKGELPKKIRRLTDCSFTTDIDHVVKDFISENKQKLALEIEQSPFIWRDDPQQNFCALTSNVSFSPIYLSWQQCLQRNNSRDSILRLIAHEPVHHIINAPSYKNIEIETFADMVANAILSANVNTCPKTGIQEEILKANSFFTCYLLKDALQCKMTGEDHFTKLDFSRPLKNAYDLAIENSSICVLDELGVVCYGRLSHIDFSKVEENASISQLFSQTNQLCMRNALGFSCLPSISEDRLYLPLSEDTLDFYVSDVNMAYVYNMEKVGICVSMDCLWFDAKNPYLFAAHETHMCFAAEEGVFCWGGNQEESIVDIPRTQDLLQIDTSKYVKQLTVNSTKGCALYDNHIKCWQTKDLSSWKTIAIQPNSNTKIALSDNQLCYTEHQNIICTEI